MPYIKNSPPRFCRSGEFIRVWKSIRPSSGDRVAEQACQQLQAGGVRAQVQNDQATTGEEVRRLDPGDHAGADGGSVGGDRLLCSLPRGFVGKLEHLDLR